MFKRLIEDKKVLSIVIIVLLVIAFVVIGIVVSNNSNDSGKPNVDIETEGKNEDVKQEDEETYDGTGLTEKKEDDGTTENRTDASGSWEEHAETSDNKSDDNNQINDSDDKTDDSSQQNTENVSGEDTLIDADKKTWGDIY